MMKCPTSGCPGDMQDKHITHTFIRRGKPIVIENIPAQVCPVCSYTVFDLEVLDWLFAFDPETTVPVSHAPVYRVDDVMPVAG
jgi:YgiT-type zinc finger domain-containing protein